MNRPAPTAFHLLADNAGNRRTEIIYLLWFVASLPLQWYAITHLRYDRPNDALLLTQSLVMATGTLVLPLVFRAPEDRGQPLVRLYGFRRGVFLCIWAVLGGFIGTDPWYEVLHGHFAFNTAINPNGVPLFMLPMTISVFGCYSVILGSLNRVLTWGCNQIGGPIGRDTKIRHAVICLMLAGVMPLAETFAYSGANYCFDNGVGMWGLNILIYGSWHFAALLFYTRWDTRPGQRADLDTTVLSGFAALGILMTLMAITKTFIAPHFVDVSHGLRQINDWSPGNCLGPKP